MGSLHVMLASLQTLNVLQQLTKGLPENDGLLPQHYAK
jgi:hypothetical protein